MTNTFYRLQDVLLALVQHNMKHIDQFKDPTLGRPILIHNSQDMMNHIVKTLFHPGTKSFTGANNRDVFYNPSTNTMVIINSSQDKNGHMLGGTAFRPEDKEAYFNSVRKEESWKLGRNATLHKEKGIVALQPEIAKEFAQAYLHQRQEKGENLEKSNPSPKPDSNEKRADLTKPSVTATELTAKTKQENSPVKPLTSRKLTR